MRQTRQGTDISSKPNIHLLNAELRRRRREPHITRQRKIKRESIRYPMQDGDNGLLALLQRGNAVLELDDVAAQGCGFARAVGRGGRELALRCGGYVEAGGKGAGAGAGEEDGADGGVVGEGGED